MAQTALNQTEINNQVKRTPNAEQLPTSVQNSKTLIKRLWIKRLLKWSMLLLLSIVILLSVVFAALHYRLLDLDQLEARFGQYPIAAEVIKQAGPAKIAAENAIATAGEYLGTGYSFIKSYITESLDTTTAVDPAASKAASPPAVVLPKPSASTASILIDDVQLKQQEALALAAEQKRLAKVAGLYNLMKAEAAAPILNELNDETVILIFSKMEEEQVSKIMTLFEPSRSARLSDAMLKGRNNR